MPAVTRTATCLVVALLALGTGCDSRPRVPPRLPGVSGDAVWAGGVDGGAWIDCWLDRRSDAHWCTVWSDQTGRVVARTLYVEKISGAPVSDAELEYQFFDGLEIGLRDGRRLEPLTFHRSGKKETPPAPVEPERSREP